ncbi:DUF7533 family protein [Natronocalculus amylovorans]|uniref:Uncharacterized protein n=1 Tax=Natronocalculus amylovorans TaxID=2917812 RepID=A0AAE3FU19_9EURY|nr:hypothetical protein [Natronocalculus amylovorans]MCL9815647.1 hypothetical protein [Natronocalculus amylovorans]NUE01839.1 hypothetical protein [Halorubraceae archaeon YAN]
MKLGVIDMISLAATLVFAIPVANYGVTRLLAGDTILGVGMVIVAVAMVVIPQYILDPRTVAKRLLYGLLPQRLRGEKKPTTKQEKSTNRKE